MTRKIFVVDDSPQAQRMAVRILSELGYEVSAYSNGEAALKDFDEICPDAIITDTAMLGMSGFELCEKIKARGANTPVLLAHVKFEPYDDEQAEKCGADCVINKPFEASELEKIVNGLLERSTQPARAQDNAAAKPAPAPIKADESRTARVERPAAAAPTSSVVASAKDEGEDKHSLLPKWLRGKRPEQVHVVPQVTAPASRDELEEYAILVPNKEERKADSAPKAPARPQGSDWRVTETEVPESMRNMPLSELARQPAATSEPAQPLAFAAAATSGGLADHGFFAGAGNSSTTTHLQLTNAPPPSGGVDDIFERESEPSPRAQSESPVLELETAAQAPTMADRDPLLEVQAGTERQETDPLLHPCEPWEHWTPFEQKPGAEPAAAEATAPESEFELDEPGHFTPMHAATVEAAIDADEQESSSALTCSVPPQFETAAEAPNDTAENKLVEASSQAASSSEEEEYDEGLYGPRRTRPIAYDEGLYGPQRPVVDPASLSAESNVPVGLVEQVLLDYLSPRLARQLVDEIKYRLRINS